MSEVVALAISNLGMPENQNLVNIVRGFGRLAMGDKSTFHALAGQRARIQEFD